MNRPSSHDPEKEQFWRQTFQEWKASGLTRKQFCRQRQLSIHTFNYWRQTLSQPDAQPPLLKNSSPPAKPLLVPVHVILSPALEVKLANGRTILVPAGFDPKHLKQLVEALEQPGC